MREDVYVALIRYSAAPAPLVGQVVSAREAGVNGASCGITSLFSRPAARRYVSRRARRH